MDRLVNTPALPPLRQDLRLYESGAGRDGAPVWSIQDPVRNRFYQIGWLEYECLLRWPGDPARIAADIAATTPLAVDVAQVEAFARFLEVHQLLVPLSDGRERLLQQLREPGWRHWRWWLHHYLFIRVPLVRPERFLAHLQPLVAPLFSPLALFLLVGATLFGMLLVARQWETFTHSLLDILNPSGLLGFMLALVVAKTLHELGHAVVATRQGVRVAHMGVAFLVMWPMLYTDTGESWRLRSHRQRLAISVAGISVEVALAGLATLAWALLGDGALRQAALYLATTGWVLSLALNASPFMRFDGYFILSDLLDFPNLHERSGAQARVWLRRRLLGFKDPWPEEFPDAKRKTLILFAFATWLYRFVIFLGIAWAVYTFFFKALGIFLMAVEIAWFILKPAWSEISVWKKRRQEIRPDRRKWFAAALLGGALFLLLPWRFDIEAPGVAHTERQQLLFAPFPARLSELHPAAQVTAGTLLASFETPDVSVRETRAIAASEVLGQRLSGLLDTTDGMDQQMALSQRFNEQQAEAQAARDELLRLQLTAPFDGEWRDVDILLRPGTWMGTREPLGILIDPSSWVVDAYVEERLVEKISPGAKADFLPEGALNLIPAEVLVVDSTPARRLVHPMLDTRHGGILRTHQEGKEFVPSESLYRVRLRLRVPADHQRLELRGKVWIQGAPRSLAWEVVKDTLAVLVRESGF